MTTYCRECERICVSSIFQNCVKSTLGKVHLCVVCVFHRKQLLYVAVLLHIQAMMCFYFSSTSIQKVLKIPAEYRWFSADLRCRDRHSSYVTLCRLPPHNSLSLSASVPCVFRLPL